MKIDFNILVVTKGVNLASACIKMNVTNLKITQR